MLDRIAGMEVFARVAAIGSLSGAARALNMSPTMATKHMAALEDRLGVKLLHRTTRKITLNEAGRRYLESVERILLELSEADATAAAERMEVGGTLRVNVPVSFGVREIVPLLAELADLHPALSVDLGLSDRPVDLVEEGWDVAIRIGRIEDQSLIARRIARCRMLLAASPAYLAKRSPPASGRIIVSATPCRARLAPIVGDLASMVRSSFLLRETSMPITVTPLWRPPLQVRA